ncbi:hypothetical protein NUG23_34625, partial [Streptomyces sp. PAL114]|nr:hypothetical protein [Streptomyces sp. PAL114]
MRRLRSRLPARHGTRRHRPARLNPLNVLPARDLTRRHGNLRAPRPLRRNRRLRNRPGTLLSRNPGLRCLPHHLGLPGRRSLSGRRGLLVLVRPGRRQREHRARRRLLGRRPLVRGGQRPPAPSRRLRLLPARTRALRRDVHRDPGLRRPVGLAGGGQCRCQRGLVTGRAPGTPAGRCGHPLRRYGPTQPRVGRRGARGMFGGRDDGALGHPRPSRSREFDLGARRGLGGPAPP